MRKQSIIKKGVLKSVSNLAVKAASQNVNAACVWWLYQPEVPKTAKKLRKF